MLTDTLLSADYSDALLEMLTGKPTQKRTHAFGQAFENLMRTTEQDIAQTKVQEESRAAIDVVEYPAGWAPWI